MYQNLVTVGGIEYDVKETEFAEKISKSLGRPMLDKDGAAKVGPMLEVDRAYGSTDVGDVSFTVPTAGLSVATWVPGTPAHSWQAVAAGGTSIGLKGMMVAAKTLAGTAINLMSNPKVLSEAKEEFEQRRGPDFEYIPLLGDRAPALNYRD
jgi:aminobenzoyl-glutamate utilization protein B